MAEGIPYQDLRRDDEQGRWTWKVDPETVKKAGRGEVCEHCLMPLPKAGRQPCVVGIKGCPMESFSFLVEVSDEEWARSRGA